jgi:alkylation response protein AidB-like acyl-CoA dehydrogenase
MPNLSPEQEAFADTVARVAAERIAPIGARMEADDEFPHDLLALYRELGWLSILTPERFGGAGAGSTEWVILAENIARHSTAACQLFQHFGAVMVLRFAGTPAQQERLFPVVEERVSCLASTEAEAGSDLGAIRCHAVDKGGSFVVNGEKCFITNGDVADVYTTLVTVEPGSGPTGIRLLLIDGRESPGVSVTARERKMGLRGSTIVTLSFDDVEVPADNMIGGERGFGALMGMFDFARPNVAAQGVGLASAAMEYALGYTLERRAFGRPVYGPGGPGVSPGENQGVSFMVADMAIRIEAGRELVYAAAAEIDRGGPRAGELAAMAKTFCTDTAMAVTSDAVQCLGQHGYLADHPVERMMRDAKVLQIYEGTNQIQRLILSRILAAKLPRVGRQRATR